MSNEDSLTSTITGSKWHHNVAAESLSRLAILASEINDEVQEVVSSAARAQIRIGRLLLEARDIFPGDDQFGKWRVENTTITSKESANKLMNLARQCGNGRLTEALVNSLPISTLKELLTAPDNVIKAIETMVESGEAPTKIETRLMVQEAHRTEMMDDMDRLDDEDREPEPKPKAKMVDVKAPKEPAKPVMPDGYRNTLAIAEEIVNKNLADRVRFLGSNLIPFPSCMEIEWAWMVFGMDPNPASLANKEVIEVMLKYYLEQLDGPFIKDADVLRKVVEAAHKEIKDEYKRQIS